jgi:hypothetical protein
MPVSSALIFEHAAHHLCVACVRDLFERIDVDRRGRSAVVVWSSPSDDRGL